MKTIGRKCKKCGSRERYQNGTLKDGVTPRTKCAQCHRERMKVAEPVYRRYEPVTVYGSRKCAACGILLDHPATMDCGDKCGWCAGKVPLYRDLHPIGLDDYVPFKPEWA